MSNFSDIKKRLTMSTTMPAGTAGGAPQWMMGSAAHQHEHKADGSCCGHDHDHSHSHTHEHHHHDGCCDHDDEEDTTNPQGGCC